jgi:hypothetical protein
VRAFGRDMYNPEQTKTLQTDLQNGTQQDRQNFLNTLAMARQAKLVGNLRAMP